METTTLAVYSEDKAAFDRLKLRRQAEKGQEIKDTDFFHALMEKIKKGD